VLYASSDGSVDYRETTAFKQLVVTPNHYLIETCHVPSIPSYERVWMIEPITNQ